MRKLVRRTVLFLLAAFALAAAADALTYDARPWLADLDRLEADMAQGYANLDWIAEHRGVDLARLDRETRARLETAHSRVRAFAALRDFLRAFRDPHLKLEWGHRPVVAAAAPVAAASSTQTEADPPAGADCAASGYETEDHGFRVPVAHLPGWRTLGEAEFPHGLAGELGVLRIAALGEDKYAAACARVFRAGMGQRELQLAVRSDLQARLRAAIAALRSAGAKRLLVDVSGNGGGSEWVSEVIALLTADTLSRAQARIVAPTCDRRGVWRGERACSVFGDAPAERATLQGAGAWRGPLLVWADRGTASAAEDLVAWLQQNRVATVLGETTLGAGCGYMDGGTRTALRASPFDVRMPNCARFLEDGRNEVEGIAPDVAIDLHAGDEAERAAALVAALAPGGR